MCGNCGCAPHSHHEHDSHSHPHLSAIPGIKGEMSISVLENILEDNDVQARANKLRFSAAGVLAINLMSSPGSGKTRLLEVTADALGARQMVVIEGDLETENDAERLLAKGVSAYQITTGMACHLDAAMVSFGADHLDFSGSRYLFIENVGNLVCPANFDLGQHVNVVLLSIPEGDDKPEKYPIMFRAADLVLITKVDLAPFLDDFDIDRARTLIHLIQPNARVIACSAKTGDGVAEWLAWLADRAQSETSNAHRF